MSSTLHMFTYLCRFGAPIPICRGLIANNTEDIEVAKTLASKQQILDKDYITMTLNCTEFINKRGYITKPLSKEEETFPIAYSILMYKDVSATERLLRAIYQPQNYYVIHVDLKARKVVYDAVDGITKCFPNVWKVRDRYDIKWGYISLLNAELSSMEQLLLFRKWKYLINLTGQEFPLWSNRDIVRTLMAFNGANNVEGSAIL